MVELSDIEFNLLKKYLSGICGIEVPTEKQYLFRTRLSNFLMDQEIKNFSVFYNRLTTSDDNELQRRLVQAMTTHESSFFRDGHPFDVLLHKLLPAIAERRIAEARYLPPRIRILSSGCSLGQEPYSIAMCVKEWLKTQDRFTPNEISILGADVSEKILARAAKGTYTDLEIGKSLPNRFRLQHFTQRGSKWVLSDEIRRMVSFAELNLVETFQYIGKFDIIFCRNVFIYFSTELTQNILAQFHTMLRPGGALILGASESLYKISDQFKAVHEGQGTYYVPVEQTRKPDGGRSD